ncbi:homocysteine-responsive endoplasmic reticulum-resident ubiquitin-like domain member 2 protein [Daphnia pulicaria]|uniref:homocysteine-responsive endoplasmic reticulum-resident ubiquitin-like domain member 2 protein n=1 Tax=Daphnia pulicaria TaxID=35523 RepID=UPI001EEB0911|nr:homocysteine-responsive endoplasmic reticulum-resident ubiquitin-like domain member 2 protein [Daphnia pulicaria]
MPPVTLVIKTPSLKLSDVVYSGESTSSVNQLKIYLQNQYPSKPKPEEQRLIYQGKLLRDNEIFQDFLRDLDHEQTHTLHLVYTLKRTPSAENREQVDTTNAGISNVVEDGLRHRNTASVAAPSTTPAGMQQPQQEWDLTNGQFPVWANQNPGADPVTQQLLWWQQTYAQQYWAQYMHHISNGQQYLSPTAPAVSTPVVSPPPPPAAPAEINRPQQEQVQRRPPLPQVGGVAQEDDDDGARQARDWLDWVYITSRMAILLGVMYYYSSLPRFMLVTLIVAGIYFYQKALHQRRNAVDRNREIIANAAAAAEVAANREVIENAEQVAGLDGAEAIPNNPLGAEVDPRQTNTATDRVQPAPATVSGFNVALNLLVGFFTSLIPEVPAPEALN